MPLEGLKVLDFSVQLPGPLATLMLAEAGAAVVKLERPGGGDPARLTGNEVEFALLNRGKKSIVLDLKSERGRHAAVRLALEADVLVEQFRPGVMARLGLGYEALRERNPGLVYCSISGYGQSGALRQRAGHDLNYAAICGLLAIPAAPQLPPTQIADIGGGALPAVINILLALRQRDATGRGCHLDIAMADNLFMWMRRSLAPVFESRPSHPPGCAPSAGGLARYNLYVARDGRHLAVAALEEAFWQRLCELVGMPPELRDDRARPDEAKTALAARFRTRDSAEWLALFDGEDVCVELVHTVDEGVRRFSGLFEVSLALHDGRTVCALPVAIDRAFRRRGVLGHPALGSTDAGAEGLWSRP